MAWQPPKRKNRFISPSTLLAAVVLCLIYYTSWNWLRSSRSTDSSVELELQDPILLDATSQESANALPPQSNNFDEKKLAFLVETRPLPHLPALFAHMTAVIPPEWKFKFMGSPKANSFMRENIIIKRLEESGKLEIVPLPSNYSLASRETISQMFTDPHLYRDLLAPAEHLLVFQPDSIFCTNAPRTLNDFLEYDWIGAPWSKKAQYGGNGGLSLRKVSKILQVLEKQSRKNGDGALEDLWLSNGLRRLPGARMAVADVSKTFSVESVWDDAPLGYHIGWLGVHHEQIWDKEDQVQHVLEYCPEVKMILGMKLDNDKPANIKKIEQAAKTAPKEIEPLGSSKEESPKANDPAKQPMANTQSENVDSTKLTTHKINLLGDGAEAVK